MNPTDTQTIAQNDTLFTLYELISLFCRLRINLSIKLTNQRAK